jgi:hypothetical protein
LPSGSGHKESLPCVFCGRWQNALLPREAHGKELFCHEPILWPMENDLHHKLKTNFEALN